MFIDVTLKTAILQLLQLFLLMNPCHFLKELRGWAQRTKIATKRS